MGKHLAIVTDRSYPSVGGQEQFLLQLSEQMVRKGHRVTVLSHVNEMWHNGVHYLPMARTLVGSTGDVFTSLSSFGFDHLHCYSDTCGFFPCIVKNIHRFPCSVSVNLAGAVHLSQDAMLRCLVESSKDQITFFTHSHLFDDADFCRRWNIPFTAIPRCIDLEEMRPTVTPESTRRLLGVNSKHFVLCVANFAPWKGQDQLIPISRGLSAFRGDDFQIVLISHRSTISSQNKWIDAFPAFCEKNKPHNLLLFQDLKRQDVINALFAADVLVLPSLRELSPIVLLEAQAAGLPWVSLSVGNAPEMEGGVCISSVPGDNGLHNFGEGKYQAFVGAINDLLDTDSSYRRELCKKGRNIVESKTNWGVLADEWVEAFFSRKV